MVLQGGMKQEVLFERVLTGFRHDVDQTGCNPWAIVINRQKVGDHTDSYCTHMEIYPPDRDQYLVSGHYDLTFTEAHDDFVERRGNK